MSKIGIPPVIFIDKTKTSDNHEINEPEDEEFIDVEKEHDVQVNDDSASTATDVSNVGVVNLTDIYEKYNHVFNRFCELTGIDVANNAATKGNNIQRFNTNRIDEYTGDEYEVTEFIDTLNHKILSTRYYIISKNINGDTKKNMVCSIVYDSKSRIAHKSEFTPSLITNRETVLEYSESYKYHDNGALSKRIRMTHDMIIIHTFNENGELVDTDVELFIMDSSDVVKSGYRKFLR